MIGLPVSVKILYTFISSKCDVFHNKPVKITKRFHEFHILLYVCIIFFILGFPCFTIYNLKILVSTDTLFCLYERNKIVSEIFFFFLFFNYNSSLDVITHTASSVRRHIMNRLIKYIKWASKCSFITSGVIMNQ